MREAAPPAAFGNQPPAAILELSQRLGDLTETMLRVASLPEGALREVEALCAQLERTRAALAPHALNDAMPRMGPEPASQRPYYTTGVVMGPHHPLRPELEIAHADGVTRGRVRFGVTFEGPPGCVHGGYVAHFFDQILGQHNLWARIPAMTGTLSVRYRRGTPILRHLRFEVTHESVGERKVLTRGFLAEGEEVFSEAEGTFVVPRSAAWRKGAGE